MQLLLLFKKLYLLSLSRGCNLASPNSPNWFICQHNICPIWYFFWKTKGEAVNSELEKFLSPSFLHEGIKFKAAARMNRW